MRRLVALALLVAPAALALLAAPAARTQPAPGITPWPETALHLSDTAEVARAPDEVVAVLRAEARGGSAAAVQEAVNRTMAQAIARAAAVPGVSATTGGYWTTRVQDGGSWQASQQLTLRSGNGAALLELAGALQQQGLMLGGLNWTLRRDTQRVAREEAAQLALDAIRRRADAVAAQLGMVVVGLREVRIDAPDRGPRPMMAMAAARTASAAPPVAVAEDIQVAATVEAVAILRPR
jgi:predicted secreted protein